MARRSKGDGGLYRRDGSRFWWMTYVDSASHKRRESTRETSQTAAQKVLRARLAQVDRGHDASRDLVALPFRALREAIVLNYETEGRKSLDRVRQTFKHLERLLGHLKVAKIRTHHIETYTRSRRSEGAAPATVRQELAHLGRAFRLLRRSHSGLRMPEIPKPSVENTRSGFITPSDLRQMLSYLPEEVAHLTEFAFWTGWRKGEVLGLRWRNVDWERGLVRLDPGSTKNREGRTLPFQSFVVLQALLEQRLECTRFIERETGQIVPWVFHRNGAKISDFRTAWKAGVEAAGWPELLFHDLRRSAVVNFERAGVPRSVAMSLTGHKTEAVYRRYAIADLAAQEEGLAKVAAMISALRTEAVAAR